MEKIYSSVDICSIIKTCGEAGVSEFNLGKLRIVFKSEPIKIQPTSVLDLPSEEQQEVVLKDVIERDEIAFREAMLAQMEIEDPVAYEKLMISGDLVDSKVGEASDEGHI